MSDRVTNRSIEPALTAEEWAVREKVSANGRNYVTEQDYTRGGSAPMVYVGDKYDSGECIPELRHALAALALHGQPFGFRAEMAEAIAKASRGESLGAADIMWLRAAVGVILALLPPRGDNAEMHCVSGGEGE